MPDSHLVDHQYNKDPDVWSGALWLGGCMSVVAAVAESSGVELWSFEVDVVEDARRLMERIPVEVRAQWPGTFVEYPYNGELEVEHQQRIQWHREGLEEERIAPAHTHGGSSAPDHHHPGGRQPHKHCFIHDDTACPSHVPWYRRWLRREH